MLAWENFGEGWVDDITQRLKLMPDSAAREIQTKDLPSAVAMEASVKVDVERLELPGRLKQVRSADPEAVSRVRPGRPIAAAAAGVSPA